MGDFRIIEWGFLGLLGLVGGEWGVKYSLKWG